MINKKDLKVGTYYHVRVDRQPNDPHSDIQVARFDGDDKWTFGEQTKDRWWDVESIEAEIQD